MALCERFHKMPHELTTDLWRSLQIVEMGKRAQEQAGAAEPSATGVGMSEREAWLRQLSQEAMVG